MSPLTCSGSSRLAATSFNAVGPRAQDSAVGKGQIKSPQEL